MWLPKTKEKMTDSATAGWLFPWVWNKNQRWTNPPSWTTFILSPRHTAHHFTPQENKGTKMVAAPFYFHLSHTPTSEDVSDIKYCLNISIHFQAQPSPHSNFKKINSILAKSGTEIQSRHQSHVLIVLLKHSMFLANISFEEGPKIRLSFPSTLKCLPTNQILEENEDQVQNKYQDNQKTTSTKF